MRRIAIVAAVLAVLAGSSAAWLIYKADQIKTNLESSLELLPALQEQLVSGDTATAKETLEKLQDGTARARSAGTDPVWRAASVLPFIGPNFSAVTEVSVSADDLVNRAIKPLAGSAGAIDWTRLIPADGKIDVAALEQASATLSAASATVHLSYDRLSSIDASRLLPQISAPLGQITSALDEARSALGSAASAAQVLPPMLGSEEARNHLLLIQNSAEIRATGGIPGALAIISADDGEIELTAQSSASALGRYDPAVLVDPAQAEIYSPRMGRFMQSVNLTPDFPTAARTAAAMWEHSHEGTTVDGVLALDPPALANILRATGPVELKFSDPRTGDRIASSGLPTALTAENVVPTLLSDVYAAIEDTSLQDDYFAAVAAQVFQALTSGQEQSNGLISSLVQSAEEGRLYVWSAHPEEQAIIASTAISGKVTGPAAGGAAFGAYFNDGTGAKMDYYVRRTVQLQRSCTPEGYLQYTLAATLSNTAPVDAAESLPAYVTGDGAFGVEPGTVQTNFVGYGPNKSRLQTARMNEAPVPLGSHLHGERPVGVLTTRLAPGETVTVELDFTNVVQQSAPSLDVTPTVQPANEVILPLTGDTTCG